MSIYVLKKNNVDISLSDIFEKNISLNHFNHICNKFNIYYIYNYFKQIPENIYFYFKLKNINIYFENNHLLINNKYLINACIDLLDDNDIYFLFKSLNKYLIIQEYNDLFFYGSSNNIYDFINYLNLYFDMNLNHKNLLDYYF